jgi:hypothetical protein
MAEGIGMGFERYVNRAAGRPVVVLVRACHLRPADLVQGSVTANELRVGARCVPLDDDRRGPSSLMVRPWKR